MLIKEAKPADAEEILNLQKKAYLSEADIYNDYSIPPLLETPDATLRDIEARTVLKAVECGAITGSVRAYADNGVCYISRLFVAPAFQNKGVGRRLLLAIEKIFKECTAFELFTGHRSVKNLRLYQKLGYEIYKTEKVHANLNLVYLKKQR